MSNHQTFHVETRGRALYNITPRVDACIASAGVLTGLCTVFIHHTSASLIITENADPQVHRDLEAFMARLVLDGDPLFGHTDEGPDDMASHVRSVLTQTSIPVPVVSGRCDLGTWQSIYLWEHRHAPHRRRITAYTQGQ